MAHQYFTSTKRSFSNNFESTFLAKNEPEIPSFTEIYSVFEDINEGQITSPSDPIEVFITYRLNPKQLHLILNISVRNITSLPVSNIKSFVTVRGPLEFCSADTLHFDHIDLLKPFQAMTFEKTFKLLQFHANSILFSFTLESSDFSDDLNLDVGVNPRSIPYLDSVLYNSPITVHCLPFRLNMNELVLPLTISAQSWIEEWDQFPAGITFEFSAHITCGTLMIWKNYLKKFYSVVMDWSYLTAFQIGYAGVTWWNDKLFMSINGFSERGFTGSPDQTISLILRFEFRSHSTSLLNVIKENQTIWTENLLHLLNVGQVIPNSPTDPFLPFFEQKLSKSGGGGFQETADIDILSSWASHSI